MVRVHSCFINLSTMYCLSIIALSLVGGCFGGVLLPALPKSSSRIIGGSLATIDQAPYVVSLKYSGTGSWNHICGGTILSKNHVITSAHCIENKAAGQLMVRVGSTFENREGTTVYINGIMPHPGFDTHYDNDIALLHLSTTLTLGPTVSAVVLPSQGSVVPDTSETELYGWGSIKEGQSIQDHLNKVTIPIVNHQLCEAAYSEFRKVTTNMICAGLPGIGDKGPCDGDYGGPLIFNHMLVGIASWSKGCGEPNYPGVFTNVANFRYWIDEHLA